LKVSGEGRDVIKIDFDTHAIFASRKYEIPRDRRAMALVVRVVAMELVVAAVSNACLRSKAGHHSELRKAYG
jgi:hypothetical protein